MPKTAAIVSLSSGILGEPFVRHELSLGLKRLEQRGLTVKIMDNALKGMAFLKDHPEARAEDLLNAFRDPSVDIILCAIGGDDTYRLLPYLFDHDALKRAVTDKIFLGFSDTTMNHFMLHKVGLNTFYGQAFLPDVAELDTEMLPYTKKYLDALLSTGRIEEIAPSDVWYEERTSFDETQMGTKRISHPNRGFELLQGAPVFSGKILGGCIDSIYDIFNGDRYGDSPSLCRQYGLFPSLEDWTGKILLLESSEEKAVPEKYRRMLRALKETGIFAVLNGVIAGKPMDEVYYQEYKQLLVEEIGNPRLPILYNVNVGHATPRCIIPFGIEAEVDFTKQRIRFL